MSSSERILKRLQDAVEAVVTAEVRATRAAMDAASCQTRSDYARASEAEGTAIDARLATVAVLDELRRELEAGAEARRRLAAVERWLAEARRTLGAD